jgi:flagellar biosynthesis protein FlhG
MTSKAAPVIFSIKRGKGGVGKTSLSINLAYALIHKGNRVLLVDGDLGLANVDVMLALSVQINIRSILERATDPLEAVVYLEQNMGVLPASSGVPEMVNMGPDEKAGLAKMLKTIMSSFDYVLLDTAAGIGPSVLWFNSFADHNLLVLNPNPTSLTDAYALIKTMSKNHKRNQFFIILSYVRNDHEDLKTYESLEQASKKFLDLELKYIGAVPEDDEVNMAVRKQTPFIKNAPGCKASQAVNDLAEKLMRL